MKIGELQEHCGECPLIGYCTDPYETPQLCAIDCLSNISTDTYRELAENVTATEIQEKLYQYEQCGVGWTDERIGAICDIIIEKLHKN